VNARLETTANKICRRVDSVESVDIRHDPGPRVHGSRRQLGMWDEVPRCLGDAPEIHILQISARLNDVRSIQIKEPCDLEICRTPWLL
jgi:hypothetical protein